MHRPAHTVGGFCTAGAGMRAGIGAHVGLTTIIGDTARFVPAMIGDFALGRGATIGRAKLLTNVLEGSRERGCGEHR